MLESLSNHFVLCGYGRIGAIVANELHRQGIAFVVVERGEERARAASARGLLVIEGDASREETLGRARIARARGLVAAVGTDAENVYAVLTARVLKPDLFVIARAESEDSIQKLQKAGADRVVSPYQIGAVQMALTALRPAVMDFVTIATGAANLELSMEQVRIERGSLLDARSIADAGLRERFSVLVVGILRAAGQMEFNPAPETRLAAGDQLVALGSPANFKALERAAAAPAR